MTDTGIRKPAVAGQFYAGSPAALKKQIQGFCAGVKKKTEALACMVPHAGYMYSGKVAVSTLESLEVKDTVILLGPNHTGFGAPFSIMTAGSWQTPLGEAQIDSPLAERILAGSRYLEADSLAHLQEHSLEVEVPILQYFRPEVKIVPIAFLNADLPALKAIGLEIASALKDQAQQSSSMLLASSDMTHYEPQERAKSQDQEAIQAILKLDEDLLAQKVTRLRISMCGYAPAIVMLCASKALGATHARLVNYQTSGEVSGDFGSVVGYAGITIW